MTPAGFVIIGRRFTFYPSFRNPGIYRVFRLFCTSFSHFDVKDLPQRAWRRRNT
ncbi:hypothetical protein HMPREF2141_01432 [Bacteroides uniformis]|nr:hypothetical protein HMPREF2141_01432 [Bacteroides uniformis]DAZ04313.1 MAG TPA: hypothetical protein [Caudoviricetes sp.]